VGVLEDMPLPSTGIFWQWTQGRFTLPSSLEAGKGYVVFIPAP